MPLKNYLPVVLVSLLIITLTFHFFKKPVSEPCLPGNEAFFEGLSYYEYLKQLVIGFPEKIPGECKYSLKAGSYYVPATAMFFINAVLFLPLVYAINAGYRRRRKFPGFPETFRREYIRWFPIFFSGLIAYLVLKILPYSIFMAGYSLYPEIKNADILNHPRFITPLIIMAVIFISYIILRKLLRFYAAPVNWDLEGARFFLLMGLGITFLLTWLTGVIYITTPFLILPLYLWPLLKYGRKRNIRYLNLFFILAALAIPFAALLLFSLKYEIGFMKWWHLFWASAYGIFDYGIILTALAGISFLISGISVAWSSSPPETISEAGLK